MRGPGKIELDVSIEASNENKLAVVWLEGVPSRAFAYTANDNWMQSDPQNVKIGSDDCDIWIYRLKMYSHSLTRYEILDNFVADCGNTHGNGCPLPPQPHLQHGRLYQRH